MSVKLSLDQTITRAKFHLKKGEYEEAKNLYKFFLEAFPKNIRIQQKLNDLNKVNYNIIKSHQLQRQIDHLIHLYNQGQFITLINDAENLLEKFPKTFIVWNILGVSLNRINRSNDAIIAFEKALSIKPDYVDAYYNLGKTFQEQNKIDAAIEVYKTTLSLDPNYLKAYSMMGNALENKGDLNQALTVYKKALSLDPNNSNTYSNMGNALQAQGKLAESLIAYKNAIAINPKNIDAYINMGNTLQAQNKFDQALEAYNASMSIMPNCASTFFNKGICLHKIGKLKEAVESYKKAISLESDNSEFYLNLGNTLQDLGMLKKAIDAYNTALSIKPNYPEAYNNIGKTLQSLDQSNQAIEVFNKAIFMEPSYVDSYSNKGVVLLEQGKLNEALEIFNKGISLSPNHPETHYNMSFGLLRTNKIKEGLEEYEWRKKLKKFLSIERNFPRPYWDGKKNLKGKKILLWSEQGIGETIRWSSCLPLLSSQADKCILECQQKLVPLLKRSFPNIEVKPENRESDLKRNDFDFHLPMGSLYKCFLNDIINNTKPNSYLIPDPNRIIYWRKRLASLGSGPYIGITWQSSLLSIKRNKNFSYISEWGPILEIPDITFINLQTKNFDNDLVKARKEFGVEIYNFKDLDQYDNIDDVSALYAALDMVISHSHSPYLIASAVGTPTKLATIKQSNVNNFLFSPSSAKVDIFLKNTCETWENVFSLIAKDLQELKQKTNC